MTTQSLPDATQPAHLTDALRRSGALADGQVRDVTVESSRATLLSRIIRLRLAYDGPAGSAAPNSLILKTGLAERAGQAWNSGRQEVAFYDRVAAAMAARLVPRCFEASWNAETNAWHLLLEDLTDSHVVATAWPLPPTIEQCESIVRARARFHAAWWDDRRLGASIGTWLDDEALDQQMKRLADHFVRFADRLGDGLSRERRALYERVLDAAPRLLLRYKSHRNVTIIQSDAHVWNCFLPRDGEADGVRLLDWDAWRIDTGTDDLAYMMALHWYRDLRRRFERPLLDSYHTTLAAHGVGGYDRRALADDYRQSVLWQIMMPVWQAAIDLPPVIRWNHLERIMLAVDDLDCRELLA
jgi:hypothetical protein